MDIKKAILSLEADNNDHWTQSGLPSVEAVSGILGEQVTRKDIGSAIPGFDRDKARDPEGIELEPEEQEDAPLPPVTDESDEQEESEPEEQEDPEDAIALIEKAVAASKHERYNRNYALKSYLGAWASNSAEAIQVQKRLDDRNAAKRK